MTGKVQQARRHLDRAGDRGVGGVQSRLNDVAIVDLGSPTAPVAGGQTGGDVLGQAQDLAHLADGAAGAEVDDGGGDAGAVAAIAFVDVLDDLFAPLMLEIDIDVGRFVTVLGQEALEQQIGVHRIHRGDAQDVADRRVGGRAAPLTQDALVTRHADDVEDGQEIGGDVLAGDKGQFLVQQGLDLVGNAVGIAHGGVTPRKLFQPGLRGPIGRDRLFRVLIAEFGQIEGRARQEGRRLGCRLGRVFEQMDHFVHGLQPAFSVCFQPTAGGLDAHAFADAGQDVLQVTVIGRGVEDIVQRQQRNVRPRRHGLQPGQPAPVVAAPVQGGAQPDRARRRLGHASQHLFQPCQPIGRDEDQQQVFRIGQQVAQADLALALFRPAIAQGQQARQAAPARARFGMGDDVRRPVVEDQPRAGQQAEVRRAPLYLFGQGRIVQRILDEGDLAWTAALAHLVRRSQTFGP